MDYNSALNGIERFLPKDQIQKCISNYEQSTLYDSPRLDEFINCVVHHMIGSYCHDDTCRTFGAHDFESTKKFLKNYIRKKQHPNHLRGQIQAYNKTKPPPPSSTVSNSSGAGPSNMFNSPTTASQSTCPIINRELAFVGTFMEGNHFIVCIFPRHDSKDVYICALINMKNDLAFYFKHIINYFKPYTIENFVNENTFTVNIQQINVLDVSQSNIALETKTITQTQPVTMEITHCQSICDLDVQDVNIADGSLKNIFSKSCRDFVQEFRTARELPQKRLAEQTADKPADSKNKKQKTHEKISCNDYGKLTELATSLKGQDTISRENEDNIITCLKNHITRFKADVPPYATVDKLIKKLLLKVHSDKVDTKLVDANEAKLVYAVWQNSLRQALSIHNKLQQNIYINQQ